MDEGGVTRLRIALGEIIPEGGTDEDTMFSDATLQEFIAMGSSPTQSNLLAWEAKAGQYANLVTLAEGNSSESLSDLHKHAMAMVDYYRKAYDDELKAEAGLDSNRVQIGVIRRGNNSWL